MHTHWGTIQEWLKAALAWRGGVDGLVAEEVSIIPGMEELSNLLCIDDHRASGAYDVLVVDTAGWRFRKCAGPVSQTRPLAPHPGGPTAH
jgi:anion-transporting  ArsA/GET3 family ATPase